MSKLQDRLKGRLEEINENSDLINGIKLTDVSKYIATLDVKQEARLNATKGKGDGSYTEELKAIAAEERVKLDIDTWIKNMSPKEES